MTNARKRSSRLLAAAASSVIILAACGDDDGDGDGAADPTEAPSADGTEGDEPDATGDGADDESATSGDAELSGETIDVGVGIDTSYAPFFVAEAEGFFEDEGLDVNLRQFERGGLAVDALAAGEVQFAGSSGITTMTQLQQNPDMQAILVYEESGEYVKAVLADGVGDASEIERFGTIAGLSEYGAIQYLESEGVDPADVEFVEGGPSELKDVLVRGDIDGFVLWEPWPQQAIQQGDAEVVATSGDFGFVYVHWLVSDRTWLDEHTADAEAFVRALTQGADFVESDPDRTAEILDDAIATPPEDVLVAIEEVDFGVRGFDDSDFERYDSYQEFWLSGGEITEMDWTAGVDQEWYAQHGG